MREKKIKLLKSIKRVIVLQIVGMSNTRLRDKWCVWSGKGCLIGRNRFYSSWTNAISHTRTHTPNHQRWYAKEMLSWNTYTLHTCFCTLGNDLHAQLVIINKISASELRRKFIKSALLVGHTCDTWRTTMNANFSPFSIPMKLIFHASPFFVLSSRERTIQNERRSILIKKEREKLLLSASIAGKEQCRCCSCCFCFCCYCCCCCCCCCCCSTTVFSATAHMDYRVPKGKFDQRCQ